MKLIFAFLVIGFSLNSFAGDFFTCRLMRRVVMSEPCTICVETNGNDTCIREIQTQCLTEKNVRMGLSDSRKNSANENFFLSNREADTSFSFRLTSKGHSATIASLEHNAHASFSSAVTLNPWKDSFELIAKTDEPKDRVGSVTALVLYCTTSK